MLYAWMVAAKRGVLLRTEPSLDSLIVASIPCGSRLSRGDSVAVLRGEENVVRAFVTCGEVGGWCTAALLDPAPAESDSFKQFVNKRAAIPSAALAAHYGERIADERARTARNSPDNARSTAAPVVSETNAASASLAVAWESLQRGAHHDASLDPFVRKLGPLMRALVPRSSEAALLSEVNVSGDLNEVVRTTAPLESLGSTNNEPTEPLATLGSTEEDPTAPLESLGSTDSEAKKPFATLGSTEGEARTENLETHVVAAESGAAGVVVLVSDVDGPLAWKCWQWSTLERGMSLGALATRAACGEGAEYSSEGSNGDGRDERLRFTTLEEPNQVSPEHFVLRLGVVERNQLDSVVRASARRCARAWSTSRVVLDGSLPLEDTCARFLDHSHDGAFLVLRALYLGPVALRETVDVSVVAMEPGGSQVFAWRDEFAASRVSIAVDTTLLELTKRALERRAPEKLAANFDAFHSALDDAAIELSLDGERVSPGADLRSLLASRSRGARRLDNDEGTARRSPARLEFRLLLSSAPPPGRPHVIWDAPLELTLAIVAECEAVPGDEAAAAAGCAQLRRLHVQARLGDATAQSEAALFELRRALGALPPAVVVVANGEHSEVAFAVAWPTALFSGPSIVQDASRAESAVAFLRGAAAEGASFCVTRARREAALEYLRLRRALECLALASERAPLEPLPWHHELVEHVVGSMTAALDTDREPTAMGPLPHVVALHLAFATHLARADLAASLKKTKSTAETARLELFGVNLSPPGGAHRFFGESLQTLGERLLGVAVLAPLCYDGYSREQRERIEVLIVDVALIWLALVPDETSRAIIDTAARAGAGRVATQLSKRIAVDAASPHSEDHRGRAIERLLSTYTIDCCFVALFVDALPRDLEHLHATLAEPPGAPLRTQHSEDVKHVLTDANTEAAETSKPKPKRRVRKKKKAPKQCVAEPAP